METVREVVVAMPGLVGILLAVAAVMAAAQLVLTGVGGRGIGLRDRLERIALVPLLAVVPVAVAGYNSAEWHRHGPVRVAEVVMGVGLLWTVGAFATRGGEVLGRRRSRSYAWDGPAVESYAASSVSARLHAIALLALFGWSGIGFLAHGLGWLRSAWPIGG